MGQKYDPPPPLGIFVNSIFLEEWYVLSTNQVVYIFLILENGYWRPSKMVPVQLNSRHFATNMTTGNCRQVCIIYNRRSLTLSFIRVLYRCHVPSVRSYENTWKLVQSMTNYKKCMMIYIYFKSNKWIIVWNVYETCSPPSPPDIIM